MRAGARDGADLGGPSAPDGIGDLHHPARGVARGALLPADAVLRRARRAVGPTPALGTPPRSPPARWEWGPSRRSPPRRWWRCSTTAPSSPDRSARRCGGAGRLYLALAATWLLVIPSARVAGRRGSRVRRLPDVRHHADGLCRDATRRDPALPAAVVLAGRAVPGLRLAAGERARRYPARRDRGRGAPRGDGLGAGAAAGRGDSWARGSS